MTTRRGFLKSILALGMAPAVVKASSLMPIYVPKPDLFTLDTGDFTIEAWLKPQMEDWHHVTLVRKFGETSHYFDGIPVTYETLKSGKFDLLQSNNSLISATLDNINLKLINPGFTGYIKDLKVIKGRVQIPDPSSLISTPTQGIHLI